MAIIVLNFFINEGRNADNPTTYSKLQEDNTIMYYTLIDPIITMI
ncbi:hypothetical protein LSO9J_70039 [Candidatus Liberibacter solanacearum]